MLRNSGMAGTVGYGGSATPRWPGSCERFGLHCSKHARVSYDAPPWTPKYSADVGQAGHGATQQMRASQKKEQACPAGFYSLRRVSRSEHFPHSSASRGEQPNGAVGRRLKPNIDTKDHQSRLGREISRPTILSKSLWPRALLVLSHWMLALRIPFAWKACRRTGCRQPNTRGDLTSYQSTFTRSNPTVGPD